MNIYNCSSLIVLLIAVSLSSVSCAGSEQQDRSEWISLFNGQDIDDWIVKIHHHEAGDNYGETFRVEDGMIKVRYDQYEDFNERFGHLYYKQPFSSFHLVTEYRFTGEFHPDAPRYALLNSGVMFHSEDPRTMLKEQNWPVSVEMQFLAGLGDGEPRPTGNMCSPGTDIVYEGSIYDGHCLNSSANTYEPGEWVRAELIVHGDSLVTHIIDGDVVLEYSKPQVGLSGIITGHDTTAYTNGTPLTEGYIALQSEGQPIDFRKVKLKELN